VLEVSRRDVTRAVLNLLLDLRNQLLERGKIAFAGYTLNNYLVMAGFQSLQVGVSGPGIRVYSSPGDVPEGLVSAFVRLARQFLVAGLKAGTYPALTDEMISGASNVLQ
jgi:hypothetical protein